jgi:hypothetical protein
MLNAFKRRDRREPRDRSERDQDGSLAIAMSVLLILANLSVVVLARTMVSMTQIRRAQDFSAALASADGGLADALFKLDQSTPASISGSGAVGSGSFSYLASKVDDNTYSVKVKGSIGTAAHAIEATVRRDQKFPYALFANQGVSFQGDGGTFNVYSASKEDDPDTRESRVGSNRAIVVNGGFTGGQQQDYYAPAGSCSGCTNPSPRERPYALQRVKMPAGTTQACPPLGNFTGAVNAMNGTPFVCDMDVTFTGTVTVTNGPLVLYITAPHTLNMSGAIVNRGGVGSGVQIYKDGSGNLNLGSGVNASDTSAVLYAPETDLDVNGGAKWFGAINVNSVRVNTPNFKLGYDLSLKTMMDTAWRVTHWREVPSNSVGL